MVLPGPVLSGDDIKAAALECVLVSSPISSTWSSDPTKLAVLRAMASCLARLRNGRHYFDATIVSALAQKEVCLLHSYSLEMEEVR